MTLKLNDYCIMDICRQLSVKDNISMSKTCRRIRDIVQTTYCNAVFETTSEFWQDYEEQTEIFHEFMSTHFKNLQKLVVKPRREAHMLLLNHLKCSNLSYFGFSMVSIKLRNIPNIPETLWLFLQQHAEQLKYLSLRHVRWSDFRSLSQLSFPQVTHFSLHTKYSFDPKERFAVVQFPQVQKLILINTASIQDVWDFNFLSALVLKGQNLLPNQVQRLLMKAPQTLKELTIVSPLERHLGRCNDEDFVVYYKAIRFCESLEKLLLDYHYFYMFAKELPKLRQLQSVKFYSPLYKHCKCKDRDIPEECSKYFSENVDRVTLLCGLPAGPRFTEELLVDWVPVYKNLASSV